MNPAFEAPVQEQGLDGQGEVMRRALNVACHILST
jgi:hypothetical protein